MRRHVLIAFFGFCLAAPPLHAQESDSEMFPVSSSVCKSCHEDIHKYWENSMHALSFSDPIFQTAYNRAMEISADSNQLCLRCHAPVTHFNKDYDIKQEITREGITCDFCHSVAQVKQQNRNWWYDFNFDTTRYGPLKNAVSPIHKTAYSPLHTKSEFCAGCHEYINAAGVHLLGTYSEWKSSPYASEGMQCQHCHMPLTGGNVVKTTLKKQTSGELNLHNLQGGHSVEKVKTAARLQISNLEQLHQGLVVNVNVTNVGSGHSIPTGTPSRQLILEVSLFALPGKNLIQKKDEVFRKLLVNSQGRVLETDAEIMLHAERILSDTRIAPRETRTVKFTFLSLPSGPYQIRARLYYMYLAETLPGQMQQMLVEMASEESNINIY